MSIFTTHQISTALDAMGIRFDDAAIYAQASRFGVVGSEIDAARGHDAGRFDAICIGNGWAILGPLPEGVEPGVGPAAEPVRVRAVDSLPSPMLPEDGEYVPPRPVDEDLGLQADGSDGG